MTWWLDSAVERNRRNPDFEIPSEEVRTSLRIGDWVKLLFQFKKPKGACRGERMWVEITDVAAHAYRGTLLSTPKFLKKPKKGDPVDFLALHVADVDRKTAAQGALFGTR